MIKFLNTRKNILLGCFLIIIFVGFTVPTVFASSASDTFTDNSGTLLQNHISDNGNTWTKQTSTTGSSVITNNNRLRSNATNASVYLNNWEPLSADYDVFANIYFASAFSTVGIGGRAGSTSFTGYYVTLANSTGKLNLYRGGNATPLGTYNVSIVIDTTHSVKLEMRGSHLKVYWDGLLVIDVVATGADVINETGKAATYLQYASTDTTGFHLDNFLAQDPSYDFLSGVLSETSHSNVSASLSWTDSSNGATPITAQLQRSLHGTETWSNVNGATTSPATDTGLSPSTAYDYRIAYTDATPTTVYSNIVTVTTDENITTYTIKQSDLWDNGYDNVSAPRQSTLSRFIFTTDAADVIINGTTSLYSSYPQYAHLGVRINGVNQSPLIFTANGPQSFSIVLGSEGIIKTVEIINGLQSKPSSLVIGSFLDSVKYPSDALFSIQTPVSEDDRLLFYGDSISVGANATNAEYNGYVSLLRNTYEHNVMLEGWGYRSLFEDTNTSGLRGEFVSRIASYNPSIVWLAIGTNDYGLNKWNASSFGVAYAATIDDLHTALPSAKIICQTPLVRGNEGVNGNGNTLGDYRDQITSICNTRPWTLLKDGTDILTTSDLVDGVHPTTAGHAKYALKINDFLTITPTIITSSASSVSATSTILNGLISSMGSTTPNIRGFEYGLTDAYEIGSTTDSGLFNIGDFNTVIFNLSPNTVYHYRAYATNFAGTSYGEDQIFVTLNIPAPTSLSYTNPNTYIKDSVITPLSPTITGSELTYSISPSLPAGLSFDTSTGIISGLPTATSTQTTYTVTATNSGGSTTFDLDITVNDFVLVISSINSSGSNIVFSTNNPASTQIEYGLTNSYGNTTSETDTSTRVISHSVSLNNLSSCTTYHYRVRSKDASLNETISSDQTLTTSGCTASSDVSGNSASQVDKTIGGTLILKDSNLNGLTLTIPVAFATSSANFQAHKLDRDTVLNIISKPSGVISAGNYVYELKALSNASSTISFFDNPLTISIAYSASDVSSVDESSLKIYRWDYGTWTQLSNCSVNTSAKTVTCETSHFSTFSLFGSELVNDNNNNNNSGNSMPTTWLQSPTAPLGGFKVVATETNQNNITLDLTFGPDTTKVAISNTPDFKSSSLEDIARTKSWNICQNLDSCDYGPHNIYVRFYTQYGVSSDTLILTLGYQATNTTTISKTTTQTNSTPNPKLNKTLTKRLKGRILLQVEAHGEAYYVNPQDSKKYYMANGEAAYQIMRNLSIGITNQDLERIQTNKTFAKKHQGKIFLQIEAHGEAYYIDQTGAAHYLKDGPAAYQIMRALGLGITNANLEMVGE